MNISEKNWTEQTMSDHIEIFLAATANSPAPENIERTLVNGVSKARYQQHSSYKGDDPTPIWGIRENKAEMFGDSMETGDLLLFYTGTDKDGFQGYTYLATIQDAEWNLSLAQDIWVDENGEPGVEWPFIIYLSNLRKVNIPSERLHTDIGYKQMHLQGFTRITQERLEPCLNGTTRRGYLLSLAETNEPISLDAPLPPTEQHGGSSSGSNSRSPVVADNQERAADLKPPSRVRTEVSRIVRNTALVKQLKKEHDDRCQVCGDVRRGPDGRPYAEGHHLHPLGDGGIDDEANILVLCPNHHSDFDYGLVRIDPDTYAIDHQYEDDPGYDRLRTIPGHEIGTEYIVYNNDMPSNF